MIGNRARMILGATAACWVWGSVSGAGGAGQPELPDPPAVPDPASEPVLDDEALDEIRIELERRSRPAGSVPPTVRGGVRPGGVSRPSLTEIPGLESVMGVARGRLLAEPTFLVRRSGTLVKAPTGERVFVFTQGVEDGLGGSAPLSPMVMIPCATLERMERFSAGPSGLELFTVSGEVFQYRGRNYLLPTAFSVSPIAEGEVAARSDPPEADAGDGDDDPGDPDVQALIRDLEARRETARGLSVEAIEQEARQLGDRGRGAEASELGWTEGDVLLRRRGRLTRLGGGEWAFVTDAGARGTRTEKPLVLAPSLALLRLESLGGRFGETTSVEMSGRVLTYRTRAYLVPTLFVVLRDSELVPLQ